ncbi:MAG: Hpt domain-containing protein [Pirellulales bacterium]
MSQPSAPPQDEFFESLLTDFLDESGQLLARLGDNLLELDEWARALEPGAGAHCDRDLVNEMFRSAHSLKGLSAMLGLRDINALTHRVENVFDAARRRELEVGRDTVELMFRAFDRLHAMIDILKDPSAPPADAGDIAAEIQQLLASAGAERGPSSQGEAEQALAAIEAAAQAAAPKPSLAGPAVAAPTPAPPGVDPLAGVEDEAEVPAKYLAIFIDESEMAIDSVIETLVAREGSPATTVEHALITVHRIKGSAASIGLNRLARLTHHMEDVLQTLRDSGRPLTDGLTDILLACADAVRQFIGALKTGGPRSTHSFGSLIGDLLAATQPPAPQPESAAAPPGVPAAATADGDTLASRWAAALGADASAWLGEVTFRPRLPMVGLKARLAYEKLSQLGEIVGCHPPLEALEQLEELDCLAFALLTDRRAAAIERQLRISGIDRVRLAPPGAAAAPAARTAAPAEPVAEAAVPESVVEQIAPVVGVAAAPGKAGARNAAADAGPRPVETLRVDIERLDQLMNLAGQLVISRARFAQIGEGLKQFSLPKQTAQSLANAGTHLRRLAGELENGAGAANGSALASHVRRLEADLENVQNDVRRLSQMRGAVNELFEAVHQLGRVSDGIQQSVMDTRMVPIGPLFQRFKRVIRDITRDTGKDVRLVLRGEKTELDKRMIDELGDPLIHLVRNAADHGVKLPRVRVARGKPQQGTVTLDAFHRGNSIYIQVRDDGKGMDPAALKAKAVEKKIISEADAERLTTHQAYQLIWEPGFSTAEQITQISGRGMGMDIVRSKIEELNGTVDLDSVVGEGTTFTIKLPLTLAILPSLMAEIDGGVFALPVESVVEIVRVDPADLSTVHGSATARVRERVVSIVRLSELFTWNEAAPPNEQDDTTLVIVGNDGRELGLQVDRLLGEQDIVIKSLAENYRHVAGIAGASILGDGRVSLILDVAALVEMALRRPAAALAAT